MNKLPLLLLASALLAACGMASGSSNGATGQGSTNVAALHVNGGSNAGSISGSNLGSDVSDLGRPNAAVRKGQTGPIAPVQPVPGGGFAATQSLTTAGHDRCSAGFATGSGANPRAGANGIKHPPLPMCAPE